MPNSAKDKEQGRFEGMVIEKLNGLGQKMDEQREELISFRTDTNDRINLNTQQLASQKGWMTAIAMFAGIAGGFIKGLIFKQ